MLRWPFYEFFAGGGMARLGLGDQWRCVFANEFCAKKAYVYHLNFGAAPELRVEDIRNLAACDLPGSATLAWASFPCQDLSLAGRGEGLRGQRSGTFTMFWALLDSVAREGRRVPIVVLENVAGALTSNRGRDFLDIVTRIDASGYRAGALMIDAVHFVPQSRPRLFIIAVDKKVEIPRQLMAEAAQDAWYTHALRSAHARLPTPLKRNWTWWRLPPPPRRDSVLADVIEAAPRDVRWRPAAETQKMLSMMSEVNLAKVQNVQATGARAIGTVYKRMRVENGVKVQRAEVRFDQTSGCLRTPAGGSSRQSILVVEGDSVRSRLLSAREAARLMGLPDSYQLPPKYNEAYHVAGDGLTVPAVEWLQRHLLYPLANTIHSEVIPSCPDSCSCCSPQPAALQRKPLSSGTSH